MTSPKDRLNQLIAYLNVSKNEFAREIGVSSAMISKITTKDINFGVDVLEKIIGRYKLLNPLWLLTGIGYMWLSDPPIETNTPNAVKLSKKNKAVVDDVLGQIEHELRESRDRTKKLMSGAKSVDVRYTRRLYSLLEKKHPDLYNLKVNLDNLASFSDALYEIDIVIGDQLREAIWYGERGFDFNQYFENVIKTLTSLLPFAEALKKVSDAISIFYKEMETIPENTIPFSDYII